jgi:hypothetical protein
LPNGRIVRTFQGVTERFDAAKSKKVGKTPFFQQNINKFQLLDCRTVTVWSPTVIVPVRVIVGFMVTRKVTVELPLRVSTPCTLIQLALLRTK